MMFEKLKPEKGLLPSFVGGTAFLLCLSQFG